MNGPRSSLAAHAAGEALSDDEVRALAGKAWIEQGVALVKPSWLASPHDRLRLIELVEKVHGERAG